MEVNDEKAKMDFDGGAAGGGADSGNGYCLRRRQ
jgi:hypothetical protein